MPFTSNAAGSACVSATCIAGAAALPFALSWSGATLKNFSQWFLLLFDAYIILEANDGKLKLFQDATISLDFKELSFPTGQDNLIPLCLETDKPLIKPRNHVIPKLDLNWGLFFLKRYEVIQKNPSYPYICGWKSHHSCVETACSLTRRPQREPPLNELTDMSCPTCRCNYTMMNLYILATMFWKLRMKMTLNIYI